MIFGKTWKEQQAVRDAAKQRRLEDDKPKRIFAWWPRQLTNGRWAWLCPLWRVVMRHNSGTVGGRDYFLTQAEAQEGYAKWQRIISDYPNA